jgi:diguanylate cyclase (GGDEF)-like protein
VEVGLAPIASPDGPYVVCTIVDLSARKEAERGMAEQAHHLAEANIKLAEMASTDSLTALWNRRAFLDQLGIQMELAARRSEPLSVLFVDVDFFKEYNDEFGHLAGDDVLKQLSALLRKRARRSDYVARIGGEEFGVILPETDQRGASRLAERFRVAIERATWPHRAVTASVGATTVPAQARRGGFSDGWLSALLSEADKALYHSKENGRNRITHVAELS